MPNVRDTLDKMQGAILFSKMDMASAYWEVPIREEDKPTTAFMTPRRLLEMNVMAIGLCNSQATYQRMMDTILEEIEEVDSFVDDVVQYSKNFADMLKTLRRVFQRFRDTDMQMRMDM